MIGASSLAEGEQAALSATVAILDTHLPVWPPTQTPTILAGAQIAITRFADFATYHPQLIEATLAASQDARFHDPRHLVVRYGCGAKVRNLQDWGVPAATLVHARALMLAHHSLSSSPVFADDTWASIYRNGDYCLPHCHTRSEVSIVYMLDPGDADHVDPLSGRLCLFDPRIDWCCPIEPGRVTRPLVPQMAPGSMLLFPSTYLHSVAPYLGTRPRITLSWNITRERLAGGPRDWAG
jgi:putative 2-oxoglutarate-Fe(II)-dependent oxygenase superfamily protein